MAFRDTAGSPEQARWLYLAHSGSKSQCAIWFILPAYRASHIIKPVIKGMVSGLRTYTSHNSAKINMIPMFFEIIKINVFFSYIMSRNQSADQQKQKTKAQVNRNKL